MNTIIVISDVAQLPSLSRYLNSLSHEKMSETGVLALGLDIEYALEAVSIPFLSAREFRTISSFDRMVYAIDLADRICDDKGFSFFSHKGISLFSLYHIRIQWYIVLLTYYVDIFATLIEKHPVLQRIVTIQPAVTISPLTDIAADFEARIMSDTLKFVCTERNIECILLDERVVSRSEHVKQRWFFTQRRVFGFFLFFANLVQQIRPERKIRVLASDYWRNISPLLKELPESELILLDRAEGLKAGIRGWWNHHVQFKQLRHYDSQRIRKIAAEQKHFFEESFVSAKLQSRPLRDANFRGYAIGKLIEPVLERIISRGGAEGVTAIEHTYKMLLTLRPDLVMVRASASGQIHFLTLCLVAKKLGIPSLEIQHGQLYMGEGSLTRRRTAEYIAVYGLTVRGEMKKAGYADDKIIDAGSPRFDSYRPTPFVQKEELQVTCIAPSFVQGFFDDTYEVSEYFEAVAAALTDSPVKLAIKLKSGTHKVFFEEMLRRTFKGREYDVHLTTSIQSLFASSDLVISPMSTVIYEALIMGRPTIFFAYLKVHDKIGAEFISYADKGLLVARTQQELKEKVGRLVRSYDERIHLGKGAEQCIAANYSFDGRSARRIADAVRALAKK